MTEALCSCGHPHSRHVALEDGSVDALYCIQCDCEAFEAVELPDGKFAPDIVGELIGWRAWKVIGPPEKPRLYSAYGHADKKTMLWPTDKWFEAICPKGHVTDVPVEDCSCGIYAALTREHLVSLGYNSYSDEATTVIGKVGFAGKVIPGTQGYRAEKARVIEVYVPYERWKYVKSIERDYAVPVHLSNTWVPDEDAQDEEEAA
jgi:hypothetical protein